MDEIKKMGAKIKDSLVKPDGSINGKILAPLISLILVAIQEVAACFGLKFTGDLGAIQALVNTLLTIFGLVGVIADPTPIDVVKNNATQSGEEKQS